MNTVEIGDAFEEEVYQFFRSALSRRQLPFRAKDCAVFRKKAYHSRDRDAGIVFDVSIEVYSPGTKKLCFLYLIECKNYSRKSVSVDEIEEFESKVGQVSGSKGVVVARTSFQSGALAFARAKRIGLLRYFDGSDFKWMLHREHAGTASSLSRSRYDIEAALTQGAYQSRYHNVYAAYGETRTNSLREALLEMAKGSIDADTFVELEAEAPAVKCIVEYRTREAIEKRTEDLLDETGYQGGLAPLDEICQRQFAEAGLVVTKAPAPAGLTTDATNGVLGRITFSPLAIFVYEHPSYRVDRQRFTLAHELGHHFLGHSEHMVAEYCEAGDIALTGTLDANLDDIRRMEWQANTFASCLVLPRVAFVEDFLTLAAAHDLKDRGHGMLFVDEQAINRATYFAVTDKLKAKYGVSRSVVKYRLEGLGLLNDARGRGGRV